MRGHGNLRVSGTTEEVSSCCPPLADPTMDALQCQRYSERVSVSRRSLVTHTPAESWSRERHLPAED